MSATCVVSTTLSALLARQSACFSEVLADKARYPISDRLDWDEVLGVRPSELWPAS